MVPSSVSPFITTLGSQSGTCASFDITLTITTGDGSNVTANGVAGVMGWGVTGSTIDPAMAANESLRFDLGIANLNTGGGTILSNNLVVELSSIDVFANLFTSSFGTVNSDSGTADEVHMTTGTTTVNLGGATFAELTELTGSSWVNNAVWSLSGGLQIDDSKKIPEPSSSIMLGLGVLALMHRKR